MKNRILIPFLLFSLLLYYQGCSNREHANPFDPDNPDTSGRPIELHAIPAVEYITLLWDFPNLTDIQSAALFMSAPGSPSIPLGEAISPNGKLKVYYGTLESDRREFWIEIRVSDWSGVHTSDTTSAIFSGGSCWISHGYDYISLYSPESGTFIPTRSLGTYLIDGCCLNSSLWMIGTPGGVLYRVSKSGEGITLDYSISFGYALVSCDISPDGRLLLAHPDGLIWYDLYWAESTPWPVAISNEVRFARLNPEGDGVWIWDDSDSVSFVMRGDAIPVATWSISGLKELAPSFGNTCWIVSDAGIIHLDGSSGSKRTIDYACRSVAPASQDRCWASLPAENRVILIDSIGRIVDTIPDINNPGKLAHIPGTNVVWCGTYDQILLKILNDGRVAANASLPDSPWLILAY